MKLRGILGPRRDLGDIDELSVLNRLVRWVPAVGGDNEHIEYEADGRHAAIFIHQMGLKPDSKPVAFPGTKMSGDWMKGEELSGDRRAAYRSACMRLAYLAADRPELQYTAKEAARVMQSPNENGWQLLKRAARFLCGFPRLVCRYDRQARKPHLDVFTDTNHEGCTQTRKSTSCVVIMRGKHWIKSSTSTQSTIGLSSGESEFHGIVKGTSQALGCQVMCGDLGRDVEPRLWADATAGLGIAMRRGIGKTRHLHTPLLWVQKVFHDRRATIGKVAGAENCADLGTKVLSGKEVWKHLTRMGFEARSGKSKLALEASTETA